VASGGRIVFLSLPLSLFIAELAMAIDYARSDSVTAYLFECGDDDLLFAVSLEPTGSNLPQRTCPQGWRRIGEFALGAHEPPPVAINPQRILQAVRSIGYYIWREGKKR
jgi:hypothetical protein